MKIDPDKLRQADREELLKVVFLLLEENRSLKAENEKLKRKRARSATPFAKKKRKSNPKKPGRKPGEGPFKRRNSPEVKPEDQVNEHTAQLTQTHCPDCGIALEIHVEEATRRLTYPN